VLLLACLAVAVVNALLLGGAAARRAAQAGLALTVETLRDNLSTLARLRVERRTQLEAELADARLRLESAEAALPPQIERLDMFRLGYELAEEPAVLVLSLHRGQSSLRETPLGPIEVSSHSIIALAGLDACLSYMASFEDLGLGVGVAGVVIRPEPFECSFDVLTLSRGR
jgi:hypothetical protein